MTTLASLSTQPLVWLSLTVVVFAGVDRLSLASGRHPLCHPVLLATPVIVAILLATRTPYQRYADATAMLTFLLGPATVALAVPLWRNRLVVRSVARPLMCALLAGSITAIASAVAVAWMFGAPRDMIASVAPRAATTPVAMTVATELGGVPALAAVGVLFSGVVGAMVLVPILRRLRVEDDDARGFAAGVAAHGIGTARAFEISEVAGTFAGIGMALNAVTTAVLLSVVALLL